MSTAGGGYLRTRSRTCAMSLTAGLALSAMSGSTGLRLRRGMLHTPIRKRRVNLAAVTCGTVLALFLLVCDSGHVVTFDNKTATTVTVYRAGTKDLVLAPNESRRATILTLFEPQLFEARDEDGAVIYSKKLSWDDLRAMNWRIV